MKNNLLKTLPVLFVAFLLSLMAVAPLAQTASVTPSTSITPTTPVLEYCPVDTPSHLLVMFDLGNPYALSDFLSRAYYNPSSPDYHQFLTPSQFAARYGTPYWVTADTQAIFAENGLSLVMQGAMLLEGSGTPTQVDNTINALAVSSVYSYIVGAECMPQTYNVVGSTLPSYTPDYVRGPSIGALALPTAVSSSGSSTCTPLETDSIGVIWFPCGLQTIYDENSLLNHGDQGAGLTIAVVDAYGDPNPTLAESYEYSNMACTDFATFNSVMNLPSAPCTIVYPTGIPQLGPYNVDDALGWATETGIDTQYSHVMAPQAHILEVTSSTDYDDLYASIEWLVDSHAANMISLSFGEWEDLFYCTNSYYGCSPPNTAGLILGYDEIFQQAAAEGISVFASSGDYAAYDPYYGTISASSPATDPWVTGVGGTTLTATFSPTSVSRLETAWSYQADDWCGNGSPGSGPCSSGSGGGFSMVFSESEGQYHVGISTQGITSIYDPIVGSGVYFDPVGQRGVPDISADADPASGVLVITDGSFGPYVWGGTSLAAPLTAGMTATTQSSLKSFVIGDLAPSMYNMYYHSSFYVHHSTFTPTQLNHGVPGAMFLTASGQNGEYYVTPGIWNPVTGLGQLNVYGLSQAFLDAG